MDFILDFIVPVGITLIAGIVAINMILEILGN